MSSTPTSSGAPTTYPASSLQRQFWFAQQMDAGGGANNIASSFILQGAFQPEVFIACLQAAGHRHEILRTTYELNDGAIWARVRPNVLLDQQVHRLEQPDAAQARHLLAAEAARPFDFATGPMVRVVILSSPKTDWHALALIFPHIAVDYRTKEILSAELSADYNHRVSLAPAPVGPHTSAVPYANFAREEARWLSSPAAATALESWQRRLGDRKLDLQLPGDKPRPATQTFKGSLVEFHLDQPLSEQLTRFCETQTTTVFVTLLAAYFALLRGYSNDSDFAVGVPLTNRRWKEHEKTAGCFINILPIAIEQRPADTFLDFVRKIRRELLEAHRTQEMPFERIVATVNRERRFDRSPLHQVGFTVGAPTTLDLAGVESEAFHSPNGGAQLDLLLWHWSTPDGITAQLHYNTGLFRHQTARTLSDDLLVLLRLAITHPDRPLATLGFSPSTKLAHQPSPPTSGADLARSESRAPDTFSAAPGLGQSSPAERQKSPGTAGAETLPPVQRLVEDQLVSAGDRSAVVSENRPHTSLQLEQEIVAIWSATLERKDITLDSNFFDLGGRSLLLVKVQSEIKRRLNIDLPVLTLFQFPTIAGLTKHLSAPAQTTAQSNPLRERAQRQREALARRRTPV